MSDEPHNVAVRTLADGATAQLRNLAKHADREEARRMHAELIRIAAELARKYEFGSVRQKQEGK